MFNFETTVDFPDDALFYSQQYERSFQENPYEFGKAKSDIEMISDEGKEPFVPYGIFSEDYVNEMMDFVLYGDGEDEGNYMEMALDDGRFDFSNEGGNSFPKYREGREHRQNIVKPRVEIKTDSRAFFGL